MALLAEQFAADYMAHLTPCNPQLPSSIFELPLSRAIMAVLLQLHIRHAFGYGLYRGLSIPELAEYLQTSTAVIARALYRDLEPHKLIRCSFSYARRSRKLSLGSREETEAETSSESGDECSSEYASAGSEGGDEGAGMPSPAHGRVPSNAFDPTGELMPAQHVSGYGPRREPAWEIDTNNAEIRRVLDVFGDLAGDATTWPTAGALSPNERALLTGVSRPTVFVLINTEYDHECMVDVIDRVAEINAQYPAGAHSLPEIHVFGFVTGRHRCIYLDEDGELKSPLRPLQLIRVNSESRDDVDRAMCTRAAVLAAQHPHAGIFMVSSNREVGHYKRALADEFPKGRFTHIYSPQPMYMLNRFLFKRVIREAKNAGTGASVHISSSNNTHNTST